jgi:hypothetical protein
LSPPAMLTSTAAFRLLHLPDQILASRQTIFALLLNFNTLTTGAAFERSGLGHTLGLFGRFGDAPHVHEG